MEPWRDWYHCNGNTFGTWLRGDSRGWRSRHHREHCDGDYRSPPPADYYEVLNRQSKRLMTRKAIVLDMRSRKVSCEEFIKRFQLDQIEVVALAIDDHHFHVLGRFPDHDPRKWVGLAKKDSARALSDSKLAEPGGVWAVRFRCLPVRDRSHQVNVANYIARHVSQGAWVWTIKSGFLSPEKAQGS